MTLDDSANCIEHVFAAGMEAPLHNPAPFLSRERLLAPWTGLPNIATVGVNYPFASPTAHHWNCHPTRHSDESVLMPGFGVSRECQPTMKFWVSKPRDRRIHQVLAVSCNRLRPR